MDKKIPFKLLVCNNQINDYRFNGKNYLIEVDGCEYTITKFNRDFDKTIVCDNCNGNTIIKNILPLLKKDKPYLCKSCRNLGNRNGMFGKKHKPETIKNFKESRSGDRNAFYGKKHTNNTKKKISKKNKGRLKGKNNPMYGVNVLHILIEKYGEEKAVSIWSEKYGKHSLKILGENNPMYGVNLFDTWVSKYGEEKAKKLETKRITKISESLKEYYSDNPEACREISKKLTGRVFSDEHRKNLRISTINYIQKKLDLLDGDLPKPSFNIEACHLFDEYSNKYNVKIQHALNGGEYYISELGYWVDGYDIDNNVVYEYYEKYHKYSEDRDVRRKQEIIKHLNCKFVIIQEGEENKFLSNEI